MSTSSDTAVKTILNIISDYGSVSQTQMFDISGYSRSMISIACEHLLKLGLIVTDNTKTQNKKKNIEYKINCNLGYIIGIAIGGTSCRIGVFDLLCNPIEIIKEPVNHSTGPDAILSKICSNIDLLMKKHCKNGKILGIGMGIPTPVKYEEGYANNPSFMPGWHLYNLKDYFKEKYNCPAFIDNEVNIMALEEFQHKQKKDDHVLLCIKVGTGIGAGLVIDNKIYRGENGGAGNIGHIQINNSHQLCECGKVGCIEAIASAPAILKKASKIADEYPNNILTKLKKDHGKITIEDIKKAAEDGDNIALAIIKEAGESIGEIIAMLTMFLDSGSIVLAGQLTRLGPIYLYHIRNMVQKKTTPWIGHNFSIYISELSSDQTATGAARLCKYELFSRNLILEKTGLTLN